MSKYIPIPNFTETQVLGFIRTKLLTDKSWQRKAVICLFSFQTSAEARKNKCLEVNGIGFSKFHVAELSNIAKDIISGGEPTDYQYRILKKYMPQYSVQIESICNPIILGKQLSQYYYGVDKFVITKPFLNFIKNIVISGKRYYFNDIDNKFVLMNYQNYPIVFSFENDIVTISTKKKSNFKSYSCDLITFNKVRNRLCKLFERRDYEF